MKKPGGWVICGIKTRMVWDNAGTTAIKLRAAVTQSNPHSFQWPLTYPVSHLGEETCDSHLTL